jgi:RNA polymerase sigma-70 factor (ECF subfamily)
MIAMPGESDDFEQVLLAARGGAEWALSALYRRTHPSLVVYLRAHVRGEEEDLASDVWLEVASGLASFAGDEPGFRRLVFTIARRRAIDHGRKIGRRRTDLTDMSTLGDLRDRMDTESLALDSLASNDAVDIIRATLPPDQADVVLLRVLGGLSVAEVADIVGRRPAAVSVLQHRALRRLARRLSPGRVANSGMVDDGGDGAAGSAPSPTVMPDLQDPVP